MHECLSIREKFSARIAKRVREREASYVFELIDLLMEVSLLQNEVSVDWVFTFYQWNQ